MVSLLQNPSSSMGTTLRRRVSLKRSSFNTTLSPSRLRKRIVSASDASTVIKWTSTPMTVPSFSSSSVKEPESTFPRPLPSTALSLLSVRLPSSSILIYLGLTRFLSVPTGWSHKAFGIPDDIAAQVDRTTLWALVSVSEALMMAGITDPYEMYKFIHPSEVGSALGSGMGGMVSLSRMFRDRREEKDIQKDILQETFVFTSDQIGAYC